MAKLAGSGVVAEGEAHGLQKIDEYFNRKNLSYLKPLKTNANSEEDTDSKTDVTETFGYRVDDGENVFRPAKSNGNDEEVGEKEDEVSNTEAGKENIEDVSHLSNKK